jgi:hypothetical protein
LVSFLPDFVLQTKATTIIINIKEIAGKTEVDIIALNG